MSTGIEANVSEVFDAQILNQYVVVSQRAPRHCRQIIAVAQPPLCARKRQRVCVRGGQSMSLSTLPPCVCVCVRVRTCVCVGGCQFVCMCV